MRQQKRVPLSLWGLYEGKNASNLQQWKTKHYKYWQQKIRRDDIRSKSERNIPIQQVSSVDKTVFNFLECLEAGTNMLIGLDEITQGNGSIDLRFNDGEGKSFIGGKYIESDLGEVVTEYPESDAEALAQPTTALCFKGEVLYKNTDTYYEKVKLLLSSLKNGKSQGLISSFVLDAETEKIIKEAGYNCFFTPITSLVEAKNEAALGNAILFKAGTLPKNLKVKVLLDQTGQSAATNQDLAKVKPAIYNSMLVEWGASTGNLESGEIKSKYALGVYYTAFLSTLQERLETRKLMLLELAKYDEFVVAGRVNAKDRNTSTKPFEAKVLLNYFQSFISERVAMEKMVGRFGFRHILPDVPTMQYIIEIFNKKIDLGNHIPMFLDDAILSSSMLNYSCDSGGNQTQVFQKPEIDGLANSKTILNPKFLSTKEQDKKADLNTLEIELRSIINSTVLKSERTVDFAVDALTLALAIIIYFPTSGWITQNNNPLNSYQINQTPVKLK